MEMPFGKHKGTEIEDLPDQYIQWLHEQDWVHGDLKIEITAEADVRPEIGAQRKAFLGKVKKGEAQHRWTFDTEISNPDILGNVLTRTLRDDQKECDMGEDPYAFMGISNFS